jgi:hypothetical protein
MSYKNYFNDDCPMVSSVVDEHGQTWEFCSHGVLEAALADGCEVFVVTSRRKLDSHDQWWIDLVGKENVIHTECDPNDGSANDPVVMESWREFIKNRLNLEPISGAHSWMDLMFALQKDGIKLGDDYRGK